MTYEAFEERFNDLTLEEKVTIYNQYCDEYGNSDKWLSTFDEEFFEQYFTDPMEAASATFFGNVKSWSDEYIRFNAYGNLESLSDFDVKKEIEGYIEEIYKHPDTWSDYIEDEEDEKSTYVCPKCGHVFVKGEWDYNYDTALLDFKCPECDWEGNEHDIENEEE